MASISTGGSSVSMGGGGGSPAFTGGAYPYSAPPPSPDSFSWYSGEQAQTQKDYWDNLSRALQYDPGYQSAQLSAKNAQAEREWKTQQTQSFWDQVTEMLGSSGFASGPSAYNPNFDDPGLKAIQDSIKYEGDQSQSQLESALARSGVAQGGAMAATTAMRDAGTQAGLGKSYYDYAQAGQDRSMREWEGKLNAMISAIQAMSQGGGF